MVYTLLYYAIFSDLKNYIFKTIPTHNAYPSIIPYLFSIITRIKKKLMLIYIFFLKKNFFQKMF